MERRPQGGTVRHPRSRGGDRARRPRRDHVGRAGRAHHWRLAGVAGEAARYFGDPPGEGFSRPASGNLERAEGRSDEGIRANLASGGGRLMSRVTLLALQLLVAVVALALWQVFATVP